MTGHQSRLLLGAALAGLLALLVVFAGLEVANSQSQARKEVEDRLHDRARASAALTESLFTSTSATAQTENAKRYGGARISPEALPEQAEQSNNSYLLVLSEQGKVIGASPGTPPAVKRVAESKPTYVRQALEGKSFALSDVQGTGRKATLVYTQSLDTRFGHRVLVSGLNAGFVYRLLGGPLEQIPNVGGGHAYVLDRRGSIVASPDGASAPGEKVEEEGLVAAMAARDRGAFGNEKFFASDAVNGTPWRVVLTASEENLYASVRGNREWVPWILLGAFALAAAVALLLLLRMLGNAAQLATAHERLGVANEALERRAHELLHSNEQLDRFASIASHDLQEPLRKLQTFAERLEHQEAGRVSDTGRDYLRRMSGAAGRMQQLVDDLLAFSRITSQASRIEQVRLGEVANEVAADLDGVIDETGATVEVGNLPSIEADPLRMRQLLQNLVSNAIKFRREGIPPLVRISGRVKHDLAEIEVSDNGIGLDPRYAERIFRVFERLHGRDAYPGTGIGLAHCRRIAERHGGRISVKSTLGEGSTFTVTLPLKPADMSPPAARSTQNGAQEKPLAPA